jgi:hypothetical protein
VAQVSGTTDWSKYDRCARCGASAGEACVRLTGAISPSMLASWPHDDRPPRTGDPTTNRIVDKLYGPGRDDPPTPPTRAELHEQTTELRQSLGVLIHTGLRKAADSPASWQAWKAIQDMDDDEWNEVLRYVVEGLAGGGW